MIKPPYLCLLLLLTGCTHTLLVMNIGIANKSATSFGYELTPENYCTALSSPNVQFAGKVTPAITTEQSDFCHTVIDAELKEKAKEKK
jgi:hypothetical protein